MNKSKKRLFIDISCDRLQEIRLIHALSEGSCDIIIHPKLESRFKLLKEKLGMKYQLGLEGDIRISEYLRISHEQPITAFSSLEKPLVFPMAMVNKCYSMWSENRETRYSFAGLITESRRELMREWVLRNFDSDLPDTNTSTKCWWTSLLPERIKKLFPNKIIKIERKVGDLTFWSSNFGRSFPGKSWDDEYFKLLSRSQFVLCPKGDCVWSYRFYEAILCGAIPIVEDKCSAMNDFIFYHTRDKAQSLEWNSDIALHNFNVVKNRFTLSSCDVDAEIKNIKYLNIKCA
jgi:hypothetical protein